jgi:predicted glycosyltransferase
MLRSLTEFPKRSAGNSFGQRRYLFYSHDGQGLGHTQRNLAIAAAVLEMDPEAAVLVVTGTNQVHRLGVPRNIGVLKLPGLRKIANQWYEARGLRVAASDMFALRSSLLKGGVEAFCPDVFLADKHPLGAHHELEASLEILHANGGKAVLGLRDVLDDPETVEREWEQDRLKEKTAEHYERILIYGDRKLFDPVREYQFPKELAGRSHFCGYVVNRVPPDVRGYDVSQQKRLKEAAQRRPLVVGAVGGGEDGFRVLETFMRSSASEPWQAIAVSGPLAKRKDTQTLGQLAASVGVGMFSFIAGLGDLVSTAGALVCMGGYNTLVESVSRGTPTVCIPRIIPRTEQLIRAQSIARLGLLRLIAPAQLDPEVMRAEIKGALLDSRAELTARASALSFEGAREAARHLVALAGGRISQSGAAKNLARVVNWATILFWTDYSTDLFIVLN